MLAFDRAELGKALETRSALLRTAFAAAVVERLYLFGCRELHRAGSSEQQRVRSLLDAIWDIAEGGVAPAAFPSEQNWIESAARRFEDDSGYVFANALLRSLFYASKVASTGDVKWAVATALVADSVFDQAAGEVFEHETGEWPQANESRSHELVQSELRRQGRDLVELSRPAHSSVLGVVGQIRARARVDGSEVERHIADEVPWIDLPK